MRETTALVLLGLFVIAGCDRGTESPTSAVPPVATVPDEDWASQLAAVRAGEINEIRVTEPVSAAEFAELGTGCDGLRNLLIDRPDLAGSNLELLPKLPSLRWLKLGGPVGDAELESVVACLGLEILNLPDGVFTDAGLGEIATLPKLELLRFGSPNATDAGIASLKKVDTLKYLHLLGVPITDAALPSVAALPRLESFYLDGGRTTDAGLRTLLDARPTLHFHLNQKHLPDDPQADGH